VTSTFELTPFVEACGLRAPIDLRIVRSDGTVLAEGELDLPCAMIGRDPVCEVTLLDVEISLRHALLQAVGGRVLVADIGSRTGLSAQALEGSGPERQRFAWLTPTDPVAIGPFRITLRKPLFVRPTVPPTTPFLPEAEASPAWPRVVVKFMNGKSVKSQWQVNRLMTLIGRSPDCKINLAAEDVAPFHAYFVMTPVGLWIVDLLSRDSIHVNGEAVRYAHLKTGDVVQIGRFRLSFEYLDEPRPAEAIPSPLSLPLKLEKTGMTPVSLLAPKAMAWAPTVSPAPITATATLQPAHAPPSQNTTTPISTPPLTSSPPPRVPPEPDFQAWIAPLLAAAKPDTVFPPTDPIQAQLAQQFSQAHAQMMEQFQQSMLMMLKMFGELHREQMAQMQSELQRMQELNAEMQRLQSSLSTLTPIPATRAIPAMSTPTPSLPEPDLVPLVNEETARQHHWVYERMAALQIERQTLWQRLFGMITPGKASAE